MPSVLLFQNPPCRILHLPSASEKAEAMIPLLLDIFVAGERLHFDTVSDFKPFAPASWFTTDDPELAAAITSELGRVGVAETLRHVSTCTAENEGVFEREWSDFFSGTMELLGDEPRQRELVRQTFAKLPALKIDLGDASRCHGCGRKCETFLESLKKCTGCGKAWYHSQGCQRRHWRLHRQSCLANRTAANALAEHWSSGSGIGWS
ncbi:hypothetical protein C8035_v004915 [Colletotrichum spinosum]|uniref:MYND-type domain-containing protein n=1 Tax=Colletotrichum spinosum TaxID=1347390 RepID=A0A4R8QRV9_9PEZI|nr:hypothetical protein C8035_v004915 [Colletotrichum spinosum]